MSALLTPAELAAHLRASERTVARMVAQGCPSMLVGARRRFDVAAVTQWMHQQAEKCPSEKTPKGDTTRKFASAADAYTAAFRKVQLRAMPSSLKPS